MTSRRNRTSWTSRIRKEPATFDRLGMFNFQLPGGPTEFALSGSRSTASSCTFERPGWKANGNDEKLSNKIFMRSKTSDTAERISPANGGRNDRHVLAKEPIDPLHASMPTTSASSRLDDPTRFPARSHSAGGTDAGLMFHYSTRRTSKGRLKDAESGTPMPQTHGAGDRRADTHRLPILGPISSDAPAGVA